MKHNLLLFFHMLNIKTVIRKYNSKAEVNIINKFCFFRFIVKLEINLLFFYFQKENIIRIFSILLIIKIKVENVKLMLNM